MAVQPDKDLPLKCGMDNLLTSLNYNCVAKYDDPKRKLVDVPTKQDLVEVDGAYYDVSTQTLIYLEATTKADGLTQEVVRKHGKLMQYFQELDKQLGVNGKVVNRRLLFVSENIPKGKDLDNLDKKIRVILLQQNELEYYYKYLSSKIGEHLRYEFNKFLDINEKEESILVSAIKLNMSGTTVFLFQLPVEKILKTCYVVRKKDLLDGGYQRIIKEDKLKSIGNFLNADRAAIFPNSILVNLKNKVTISKDLGGDLVQLEFPVESGLYHIIDGQHRAYGYCQSKIKNLTQPKLIVVGFENITDEDEARYFIKINKTQTSIDATLLSLLMAQVNFSEGEQEYWDSRASNSISV